MVNEAAQQDGLAYGKPRHGYGCQVARRRHHEAGSDEGARSWGVATTLIQTAKLNGVEPQTYFAGLPTRLVHGWPQARIDEPMPWM